MCSPGKFEIKRFRKCHFTHSLGGISLKKDRKGQNAKNYKGITKTFFQSLSYNASLIENAHNTLTPSPMSGYSLDWAETKTVKVQSHSKKPSLFSQLLFTTHTCIISRTVGGSEIEVASFLAASTLQKIQSAHSP